MWRLKPTVLTAALWAYFSTVSARRQLRSGISHPTLRRPPRLPWSATHGVNGVLSRLSPTCLEGALVRQAWLASHGIMRDVVIGVPPEGLGSATAHAWLDGHDQSSPARYLELHRLPPPVS